jgi:hypothetical protein
MVGMVSHMSDSHVRINLNMGIISYILIFMVSVAAMAYSFSFTPPEKDVLILLSTLFIVISLHPLTHLMVGKLFGIQFHYIFLNGPLKIQPTLKTDRTSYLRLQPARRAVFHISGIIATIAALFSGYFAAEFAEATTAKIILGIIIPLNAAFEVAPPLLVKLGFKNFRKSDFYRFWREWKKR